MMSTLRVSTCRAYASAIVNSCCTEEKLAVALPSTRPEPIEHASWQDLACVHDGGTSSQSARQVERGTAMSVLELYPHSVYWPVMYDMGTFDGGGERHHVV